MQWLERWNEAMEYLEEHLTGGMEREQLARIACCSEYHFQRMFSYIAGVTLAEYIRRRKMTLAARDLQQGDKVTEVAMRYGYESPTAFNRAFQAVHGLPPSTAHKQGVRLKAYARIVFQLSVKGVEQMEYRLETKDEIRIVGMRQHISSDAEESFAQVPLFWNQVMQSGRMSEILSLSDGKVAGLLGVSSCAEDAPNYYYIAVSSEADVPEGMHEFIVPACDWAIFTGRGTMPAAIQDLQCRIVTDWLPSSGYEWGKAPDLEVYLNDDRQDAVFEVWLPVVKRK